MSWFSRKPKPVLTATFAGGAIATVQADEVPVEKQPAVRLRDGATTVTFRDSAGAERHFDLSSALAEGATHAFLSIRVGPTFAVQVDCLLGNDANLPNEAFARGEAKGIRFQPFFLPELKGDPPDLVGRGLLFRGLHYPGTVTPGNVSLLCICDRCRHSSRVQSFHAGFGNVDYFYCGSGIHTLVVPNHVEVAEDALPPCGDCGSGFRRLNPFRCPACRAPYIDFERFPEQRKGEYYGNLLYGERLQSYPPPPEIPTGVRP